MRRVLTALLAMAAGCSFPEYTVSELEPVPLQTCRDGLLSDNEVAVDCGPACSAGCNDGIGCSADGECKTGFCNAGVCAVPSCTDNAKTRSETDVDCGGSDGCHACTVGQRCSAEYDCDGGACITGRCQAPTCGDGLQNQDESDVDCGGATCGGCGTKQHCKAPGDCDHATCAQGTCQPSGCQDGLQNGDETATDCGGSCASCENFTTCKQNRDCSSLVCNSSAHICLAPTCNDGVKNGSEPTLDCGKTCNKKCATGDACALAEDCQAGACVDARCAPKSAMGTPLPTSGWVLTASDTFNGDTVPSKAIDSNVGTHWTTGGGQLPGMWFQIDMLQSKAFFSVELTCKSNDDYPRSIRVLLSEDGKEFTPATGTIAGSKLLVLDFAGKPKLARYIRLELLQDTGGTWWRIDELRVLT